MAPAWLVAFGGRPRLGLTVPLRAMYFQSYGVCNSQTLSVVLSCYRRLGGEEEV